MTAIVFKDRTITYSKGNSVYTDKIVAENKEYSADGEHRLLGYNSPMVQASKRYWEVQVPIKKSN